MNFSSNLGMLQMMLQVDATASICGTPLPVDAWQIDCVTA
jgi:aspartate aminotransferase-like enzyme